MIQYKKGVSRNGLHPMIYLAISRVEHLFSKYGYSATITSTNDGYHIKNSLHYSGLAVDIRTYHINDGDLTTIYSSLKDLFLDLDPNYDLILESDHIHLEYDRRQNR